MKRTKDKRMVFAGNALKAGSNFTEITKYVDKMREEELEFVEPQLFSIQFYDEETSWTSSCDREVYVITHSYNEASELAKLFCKRWGFPYNKAVVQFPHKPVSYWDKHTDRIDHLGSIHYLKIS